MAAAIAALVSAVRTGIFDDVEERPAYYASHTLPGVGTTVDAAGAGAD